METRLLIAGEQVPGDGGRLSVENPFTESELASVGLPSSRPECVPAPTSSPS
jgi:hypothetical protein